MMKIIEELYETIVDRKENPSPDSYVSSLLGRGEEKILGKLEEESNEVIEAAKIGSKEELIHEAADLLFHLLVLLGFKGVTPSDVQKELRRRRK
jgi:phosphoribosyl-ATP pyrophosphohydrolase